MMDAYERQEMKAHAINLAPYQLTAASEGRLGMVCITMSEQLPTETHFSLIVEKRIWDYQTLQKPIKKGLIGCSYAPGDVLVCGEHRYTITEVKPLWLPEISESDAVRCGKNHPYDCINLEPREIFKMIWQAHHKEPFESWVWALGLEVGG